MRERLIEMIQTSVDGCARYWAEVIADYLLKNGIVVSPCKVGDVVYFIGGIRNSLVKSAIVEEIIINDSGVRDLLVTSDNCVTFEKAIDAFYFTREEAERALKGDEGK